MTTYRRKPTPAIVWRFEGQPRASWPSWVADHEVSTNMGAAKIGMSGVGTLLVPVKNGNTVTGQSGDYVVLESYITTGEGKLTGGTLTLVRAQDFPVLFEEAPEEPAAAEA
jgi:hypothetical protein